MSKKYVSEIFGYPHSNTSAGAQQVRASFQCPYTNNECDPINKKSNLTDDSTGNLLLEHQTGACSAWYKPNWSGSPYPVIICPFRFYESNTVFNYIKNKFYNNNDEVAFTPEVGMSEIGRADYFATRLVRCKNETELTNPTHIEIQSDGTTGTRGIVECVKDYFDGEDITNIGYGYGLNSKNSIKASSLQMIDKGFFCKELGINSIWILQDYLFLQLQRFFPFTPIEVEDEITSGYNIFFITTSLNHSEDENKYTLQIDKCF